MSNPRSRNLDNDNIGIQTEQYLDESFAYVFRWVLWLPIKIFKATYFLFRIMFLFAALPVLLIAFGTLKVIYAAKQQYKEGYEQAQFTDIEIE